MNFINKIRSCFWQAPTQGENQRGIAVDGKNSKQQADYKLILESVLIKMAEENESKELERKVQELKEEVIEMMIPVMMMNKIFWNFLEDIEKASKELNIEYSLVDNIAFCAGKAKDVERFETLMEKLHRQTIRGEEKINIYLGDDSIRRRTWEKRSFLIPLDLTREDVDVILYKAKKRDLKFRFENHVLNVIGNKFDFSLFAEWLEEFTNNRKKQKQDFKEFLENLKLETITEEIRIHDLQKQDLMINESMFEVQCNFNEGNKRTLTISGRADKVRCFKSYVKAINPTFLKFRYPKHWDFSIEDAYAEIEVEPWSEEFKEIKSKVCGSLRSANLTKVKRIQNQALMNNYLTRICSEKKKKKREERKLLFYGTEIQEPERIYKYSKTGFDLSYASFNGRFGRGLYLPITALYAHGSAYKPSPKTFQVLMADVFVGKALNSSKATQDFQSNSLRAYDSILDRDNFYVIDKNSQSYPLYLVEYTLYNYEKEEIADVRLIENFECPVELSPQACDALKMQIEVLNLALVETNSNTIRVSGNETSIEAFSHWLNEFFSSIIMGEDNFKEILEKKNEKITYSMLYGAELAKIMVKATELEVDCLLSNNKDQMSLTGLPKNLESFKTYLHKINHEAKKYLFPKYWDFGIVQPYVEIGVGFGSEEFEEISKIFNYGFENAQVIRLTRIQNHDLFNSYISTICSRTQVNPDTNLQRKLLFHGTRFKDPKTILRDSEIGFDLKDAKIGSYGRGIYFSTNSSYSHLDASTTDSGTFQMLIADVYTGVSFIKRQEALLDEYLTEDHDSLFADEDNFFVLYQNLRSYPLYLVEYSVKGKVDHYPQIKLKHMTDILSGGQYCLVDYPAAYVAQQLDLTCLQRVEIELKKIRKDKFLEENFLIDKVEKPEWLVSFKGFRDTPYEGGLFKIQIIFPPNYPMEPPFIKFLTQIYHPSINEHGRICLGLLSQWTPATDIRHVLLAISCLLHDPEMEDPLMIDRMNLFRSNRNKYMKIAQDWTLKYAK